MIKVIFFPNGNTAAFKDGRQMPELQESWFLLYAHLVAAMGIDVLEIDFTMPDGNKLEIFGMEGNRLGVRSR